MHFRVSPWLFWLFWCFDCFGVLFVMYVLALFHFVGSVVLLFCCFVCSGVLFFVCFNCSQKLTHKVRYFLGISFVLEISFVICLIVLKNSLTRWALTTASWAIMVLCALEPKVAINEQQSCTFNHSFLLYFQMKIFLCFHQKKCNFTSAKSR